MNQSMLLINSVWNDVPTFRLIPMDASCPFVEGIYDRISKILVLISKDTKNSYHMLPKLDADGNAMLAKKQTKEKKYQEERRLVETNIEHYIRTPDEINNIIHMIAINSDHFDWIAYYELGVPKMEPVPEEEVKI